MAIRERIRDLPLLATTFNQLAIVAKENGRFADAERWYLRAQEIKDKVAPKDASTLSNLANLYLSQNRLDEARRFAHRALAIKETLDLSAEAWTTYAILADIAAAQGMRPPLVSGGAKSRKATPPMPGLLWKCKSGKRK
ncbi:MAG: tetratricopeptide repeat protein [Chloroflexi bacterium]|nr:tetratricopeptide repeat protein [Chloroflexota bacterium]